MPPAEDLPTRLAAGTSVVVTGGEGFLGAPLVARLVRAGCVVTSIDSLQNARVRDASEAARDHELVATDVRDRDGVVAAIAHTAPRVVFHLAAQHFIPACVADPVGTLEINAIGTQHVLDACGRLATAPTVVLISTADVYAPSPRPLSESSPIGPNNVYGLSKLTAEGLVRIAGAEGRCTPVICRLFNLYGANETNPHVIPEIVAQLRRGDELTLGNTAPRRDFVYVDDAADALVALAGAAPSGTVVNVGTGESHSVNDVVTTIAALTGRELRVVTDPQRWRPSDRENLQSDSSLLRSIVPSALPTTLVDGLRALLADEGLAS